MTRKAKLDITITYLQKNLIKMNVEQKNELKAQFRKFVYSRDIPEKDECCEKFLKRSSGRCCHTCPHHQMKINSVTAHPTHIDHCLLLLSQYKFIEFVQFLYVNNYPFPDL